MSADPPGFRLGGIFHLRTGGEPLFDEPGLHGVARKLKRGLETLSGSLLRAYPKEQLAQCVR